ncbi:MMPL family efflux pump permease component [Shewanella colwelliana]|nr:MMPL family efflux pump permease component [Shewanella colwelliana]
MMIKGSNPAGQGSIKRKAMIWFALVFCAFMLGAYQLNQGAKIQSDILAMLPEIHEEALTQVALERVESQLADRVYIALQASSEAQAIDSAQLLLTQLRADKNVFTDVKSGDIDSVRALNQFYFPHRFSLLTANQQTLIENKQLARLEANALAQLYNAFGYANSELISQDPLLLYPDTLKAMAPTQKVKVAQGILVSTTHNDLGQSYYSAIVMAKGVGSAFNPQSQQQQINKLTESIAVVRAQLPTGVELKVLKAGALFHASAATLQAKKEVSSLGLASLIGVIALVWWAFRSMMPLLIASLTIATSLLFAVVATLSLFGELHLLTLVFGTSLIGIAIDFSFHFYCERLEQADSSASVAVTKVFPAATLALITTVLAYSAIGMTPFPGMQQVAIFCAAGLIGAYITLVLAYPFIANSRLPHRPLPLRLAQQYLDKIAVLSQQGNSSWWRTGLLGIALVTALGLSQLQTDDDIRNLQQSPNDVVSQEAQLRLLLSGGTDNQFILVRAPNAQALLQQLEAIKPTLNKLTQDGVIGNAINLANYLPSQTTQATNYRLQGEIYHNIDHILAKMGLAPELASDLRQQYQQAAALTITPEAFFNSPAGQLFSPLWLPASNQERDFGAIVLLGGISNIDTLQQALATTSSVQLVDKVADISHVMAKYRSLTLWLLLLSLLIAWGIFSMRFGVRLALYVTAVPATSALLTLGLLGLFGSGLTLFHALALILVFGIGVDYSLFFAEAKQGRAVMMAVFMSACSTLLAFGLLAFSQTPAIHYFGLTLLLGIGCTFLLSPFVHNFIRTHK